MKSIFRDFESYALSSSVHAAIKRLHLTWQILHRKYRLNQRRGSSDEYRSPSVGYDVRL
nr:MAG TPA: hypothetical protein [Caudoviricetes sp.]